MPGPSYIIAILAHDTSHRRKQQEPPPSLVVNTEHWQSRMHIQQHGMSRMGGPYEKCISVQWCSFTMRRAHTRTPSSRAYTTQTMARNKQIGDGERRRPSRRPRASAVTTSSAPPPSPRVP